MQQIAHTQNLTLKWSKRISNPWTKHILLAHFLLYCVLHHAVSYYDRPNTGKTRNQIQSISPKRFTGYTHWETPSVCVCVKWDEMMIGVWESVKCYQRACNSCFILNIAPFVSKSHDTQICCVSPQSLPMWKLQKLLCLEELVIERSRERDRVENKEMTEERRRR